MQAMEIKLKDEVKAVEATLKIKMTENTKLSTELRDSKQQLNR